MARNLATDWQRHGGRASRIATMVPLDESHAAIADNTLQGARDKNVCSVRKTLDQEDGLWEFPHGHSRVLRG